MLLGLSGCARSASDTEGRTFAIECRKNRCALEPAPTPTSLAGAPWEPIQTGRLLLACPQGERGDGRECRALACDGNAVCSKLGGERFSCLEGLCQDTEHAVTGEDRLALCLAGTGAWSDSAEQRERFAIAQSCRPPCEVPALCRQVE